MIRKTELYVQYMALANLDIKCENAKLELPCVSFISKPRARRLDKYIVTFTYDDISSSLAVEMICAQWMPLQPKA
jgi:hypothetical protein